MIQKLFLLTIALPVMVSYADDVAIENALKPFGVSDMQITASPIKGLRTVVSNQGIFYASEDGKYFLQGSLVEVTPKGPVDLSKQPLMGKLEALEPEMIVYPAKDQKYIVNVFTDITCPYCLKLHQEMQGYNDRGITVRYLAFPRAGGSSSVAKQMESIWTAEDKKAAFSEAEKGKKFKGVSSNIVKKQYDLGIQFKVTGTPSIVLENGVMISGYQTPDDLLAILQHQIPEKESSTKIN